MNPEKLYQNQNILLGSEPPFQLLSYIIGGLMWFAGLLYLLGTYNTSLYWIFILYASFLLKPECSSRFLIPFWKKRVGQSSNVWIQSTLKCKGKKITKLLVPYLCILKSTVFSIFMYWMQLAIFRKLRRSMARI